ncbi:MAG TPA: FtsX-like permease family protein [Bacteroidetes bacterium]|nr:FtsX-like permease family protein [Bacteroidota bacterium]
MPVFFISNSQIMSILRNYWTTSVRNLLRYKGYAFINIAGLGIGIATAVLIFLYVQDELSYDRHNRNFDRIYRIILKGKIQSNEINGAISNAPVGPAMVRELPGVENYTRLFTFAGEPVVRYGEHSIVERKFYYADSTFFDVFTAPVVKGNRNEFLKRPQTLVLTEETAEKYFGEEDPVGKILEVGEDRTAFEVVGVVKGFPKNSHFTFDMLGAGSTIFSNQNEFWISNNNYTYVTLREEASAGEVQEQLNKLVRKYVGPQMEQFIGVTLEEMEEAGQYYGYFLQPLKDIHLRSDLQFEIEPGGSMATVIIFSLIAVFIIVIASINFMNLATARSSIRAHEVGIRKVVGSARYQLIGQFISESVIMSLFSLLLAIVLIILFMPAFNQFTGKSLDFELLKNPMLLPVLLVVWLVVGFLSGTYPAFFLASFQPVKVLKGKFKAGMKSGIMRSILVVFQFTITIVLFISTFIVFRQMNYISRKDLGFNKENLLLIQRTYILGESAEAFRQEVNKIPGVTGSSYSNTFPGEIFGNTAFVPEGSAASQTHALNFMITDEYFDDVYELEMVEGRWFSPEMPSDSNALVINEAAARALGFEDPLQHRMILLGENNLPLQIVGVVKDFHYETLHQTIKPLVIGRMYDARTNLNIRIRPENRQAILEAIQAEWQNMASNQPLSYTFLDDSLAGKYDSERSTGMIFGSFSLLAIIIASMGLLGLASFSADQRTREIGIRKVMGASVQRIMGILSKEILWLVLIATVIAWPLAWYFMKDWLQNFAFRIDLEIWVFVGATLLAFLIALLTVSAKTWKAAQTNPAEALRYE